MNINLEWTNRFIEAESSYDEAKLIIIGAPFDGTSSFRSGSRFAPNRIREISWVLETYSPQLKKDLTDLKVADIGDLILPPGDKKKALMIIEEEIETIVNDGRIVAILGGEHLITLGVIKGFVKKFPELFLIQLDAHLDLRDEYLGERESHSTVMRRVLELLKENHLFQIGPRSGTKEEFLLANRLNTLFQEKDIISFKERIKDFPIYITLDLDILDPSILPGTGTPEPGGFDFNTLMDIIYQFKGLNVVGFDIVELSPPWDRADISAIVAAKILREMILIFHP
ncbi:MAG: agmatinase [Spirochaetes bacterium]|nr:agmatinase [Deltaproteobacteria bacterium]RKY01599.1 MAG: agmatinase [Spirochaetota bacterium]